MREFSTPPVEGPSAANLTDLVHDNAREHPESVAFSRLVDDEWSPVTTRQFLAEVRDVAKGLVAAGVQPGDRVGLMSRTRYEWTLVDFAIWVAGAVTVPVYETSSPEQVQWILGDAGAVGCVTETAAHRATVEGVRGGLTDLREVWQIDDGAVALLTAAGTDVADAEIERRRATLTRDSLATIIYTSGTTGRPKGCQLTHGNFLFELGSATAALDELFDADEGATLLFLPLAHVFARIIQIGCVMTRTRMGHTAEITRLLPHLASFQPSFLLAVPRVFEKVYNSASQRATAEGRGRIFDRAAACAVAYSEALDRGSPSLLLRLEHAIHDRLVYRKLRAALGGRCRWALSGGAPLGPRLGHFFRGIGVGVLEGYGLTETTGATSVNLVGDSRIGTVGKPLPGTAARIADDGEVLLRGDHVFAGYWRNDSATAEAIDAAGWVHTGDLGALDDAGFLSITGRKKEIIVTAGGKNVSPAVLEDRLRAHALVSQCIVVGDARPFVGCLVTIDREAWPLWLAQHGRPADATVAALADDPDLVAEIQRAVDDANRAVSSAEAIKRFTVLPDDWSEETGELTPSLKLKRAVIMKQHSAEIDALYG